MPSRASSRGRRWRHLDRTRRDGGADEALVSAIQGPCQVCGHALKAGLASWHFVCPRCGYEASTLGQTVGAEADAVPMDEDRRAVGLEDLRRHNFRRLLDAVTRYVPGGSLLDVGSAHGWFLEIAAASYNVTGIEPDGAVVDRQTDLGRDVIRGYFPVDVEPSLRFDVITFNDVLEHIPNLRGTLDACHAGLNADGVVMLNLPSRTGAIYRASKLLWRMGVRGPFARMWQKGLPSPHLHYLGPENLRTLLDTCAFDVLETGTLAAVGIRGLRERIAFAGTVGAIGRWVVLAGVVAAMPLLRALPSDIVYVIARRRTP
jgi:hypothetical protein